MSPTFVYVIGLVFNGQPSRPTKVGITSCPAGRFSALQTASPYEMAIVHMFQFDKRDHAFALERFTHDFYRRDRLRGEWFNIEPLEILDAMVFELDRYRFPDNICEIMGLNKAIAILAGDV